MKCWDLGQWRVVWDAGHSLVPQGGWPLATGFGTEVTHVKGVQRAKRKKYHMTITIYPDEYEVEGFRAFIGLAVRREILEFPSHVGCAMSSQDKMPFQDRWRADRSEA